MSIRRACGRCRRSEKVLSARLAPDHRLAATVIHVDADVRAVAMVHAVDEVMRSLLATVAAAELLAPLTAPPR